MIKRQSILTYICDGCGEQFHDENGIAGYIDEDIWDEAVDSDWRKIDGKHYCPDCYQYDENIDDYVAKPKDK